MSGEDSIRFRGKILEILPQAVFRLELPNGHQLLAYTPKRWRQAVENFEIGAEVTVEVSPFDFSTGRIRCDNQ